MWPIVVCVIVYIYIYIRYLVAGTVLISERLIPASGVARWEVRYPIHAAYRAEHLLVTHAMVRAWRHKLGLVPVKNNREKDNEKIVPIKRRGSVQRDFYATLQDAYNIILCCSKKYLYTLHYIDKTVGSIRNNCCCCGFIIFF